MKYIKLSKGIIAIGFGGNSNHINQTIFALSLANQIAEEEKVLYLNWNNYTRNIENIIKSLNQKKSDNLDINTTVDYFGLSSFLEIIELIEQNNYTTIFIDNVNSFTSEELEIYEDGYKHTLIKSLKFISDKYSVRVIFNVNIDPKMFSFNYNSIENEIDLGYFRWSRKIVTDCNQVLAVQNIEGFLDGETDEYYKPNTFKIFNLKNEIDKIENLILEL